MDGMSADADIRNTKQDHEAFLFASLSILELSLAVMGMAVYLKGQRSFAIFLAQHSGWAFIGAFCTFVFSSAAIVHRYHYVANWRSWSRDFHKLVAMNLVVVVLVLVTAEIAVRVGSRISPQGEEFLGVVLKPKDWRQLGEKYRTIIERASGGASYIVYDNLMGWTVGPNKRSLNGLYYSSTEGIRAPYEGVSFADVTEKTRIALVGDSFTFGDEVGYEGTWGYHLEKALGPGFQVLNFGVSGYGLGQTYLRYEKDVLAWNPKFVIFGFISHDVKRTTWVYPCLSIPEWDMPFSKARLFLRDGALSRVNVPPLKPEAIFSRGSVRELPFLEYDSGYKKSDWQESFSDFSYLARLFKSRFSHRTAQASTNSDEANILLNAKILETFVQSATRAGSIPLIVYFPSREELNGTSSTIPLGKQVLQKTGLAYSDPTSCLLKVPPAVRHAPIRHYSPLGNAAVAECLVDVVRGALGRASGDPVNGDGENVAASKIPSLR
jgi:hypothetical protein